MTPRRRWVARAVLTGVLPVVGSALLAGLTLGADWGWGVAAAGWLFVVLVQIRELSILAAWLDAPDRCEPANAGGFCSELVRRLGRRLRDDSRRLAQAEAGLHSFREAMDAVPDGLVIIDTQHRIQWSNRAAAVHLGICLPRDGGAIIEQLVRAPGFAAYLGKPDVNAPFVVQSPAVRTRFYAVRVVSLGEHSQLLVSLDISDARRVESMRSTFVANVSHELRTPLTVVSGFLEHFADDDTMTAEQRQHFTRLMSDQTTRMLSLVDDLLTLSRLESEDAPASEEEVEMDDLLSQLLAEAQSLSEGRHRLELICDGQALQGNRKELHSAFGNLVSNSIRYTPAGGDIRIEWRIRDGVGAFCVRDSGVGIAAEHLPRLTERFYRVDRGRSRDSGGTGLGLAIVKHILLRHQAALVIESQVGKGSSFRAEFPGWRLKAVG